MNIAEYFSASPGHGILATADGSGKVNAAVFSKPHFIDEDTVAFLMSDRLTHHNLQTNPSAVYLFIEDHAGWKGKRLYLEKIREERNTDLARSMIRHVHTGQEKMDVNLVFFHLEKVLPLTGSGSSE